MQCYPLKKKRYIALFCTFQHQSALFRLQKYLQKMATVKLYLDTRAAEPGTPAPVKISVCLRGKTALHSTGVKVLPEQWDGKTERIARHSRKQYLNTFLISMRNDWEVALLKMTESGELRKAHTATDLKKMILAAVNPEEYGDRGIFLKRYIAFTESRSTPGTRETYARTIKKMREYDSDIESRGFEDIDRAWLTGFEEFLSRTSPSANARSIHLRNIRAVFNDAIDDEVTSLYPFRKFKIRSAPTRKRSLSVDDLRTLMNYPCEEYQVIYRDMFVLMFYLCGINAVDLLNAPAESVINGRLEYVRAKTHKPYSVKLEPEAMEIINRYRGKRFLLNIMDTRKNYKDFLHRMDNALKQIGPTERHGLGGRKTRYPLFPDLSQYWCRHTWATMAAELDIPKETIAAGLGHGGNTVTDIYIRFDQKKVDDANRRIIDYLLQK